MSLICTLVLGIGLAGISEAKPPRWPESSLRFSASYDGEPLSGVFRKFGGQVKFDPSAPAQSSFEIEIDTGSVDTGDSERDDYLRMPEWFSSEAHPKAHYRAKACTAGKHHSWDCSGTLELKGKTSTVPIAIVWSIEKQQLSGKAELSRAQFAVGEGEWSGPETIGDLVQVEFLLDFGDK